MKSFAINFIDHVAIRVKDMKVAADWYTKVLGLKRVQLEKWGPFPIFMMSGPCGVALFPADSNEPSIDPDSRQVKIDHFAFNVSGEAFEKARAYFKEIKIPYTFKDHFYYHSIYLHDPDQHTVELTTLRVDPDTFYPK